MPRVYIVLLSSAMRDKNRVEGGYTGMRMGKIWIGKLGLLLVLLCFLLTACSGNKLVGTWKTSLLGVNQTLTFNSDGTVEGAMLGFNTQLPLKYSVSGDKLTLSMDNSQYGGSAMSTTTSTFILKGNTLYLDGIEYTRIK